ncbi:MAG: addiction module protein [Campylobacterales bacterium]|nr:addiction module protein [Campylobacterales bacterium]
MGLNEIIHEALLLKPQERCIIIENLVESLSQSDPKIEELWIEESLQRLEAIKNDSLETVPYEEVFGKRGSNFPN